MLNLNSIMIGTENQKELAAFYEKVIGKKPDMVDSNFSGWMIGSCFLRVGGHDKVKGKSANPERILLNFETKDVKEEFNRIKGLGATVVKEPYNPDPQGHGDVLIATFADPDGNYIQLMTPWEEGK